MKFYQQPISLEIKNIGEKEKTYPKPPNKATKSVRPRYSRCFITLFTHH